MTEIDKNITNHVLVPVTSMNSGAQTRHYAAAVIEVMPSLREIEKAELIVQSSDVRIRSVDLRLNLTVLAGWDYTKNLDATTEGPDTPATSKIQTDKVGRQSGTRNGLTDEDLFTTKPGLDRLT